MDREDHNLGLWNSQTNLFSGINSVKLRHGNIHDNHIGFQLQGFQERFPSIGYTACYFNVQFALQQRLRNGPAVDGDERLVAPRAFAVDRRRHQFLAGARLADQEDGEIRVGHAMNIRHHPGNGLRGAHALKERQGLGRPALGLHALPPAPVRQGLKRDPGDFGVGEGLEQVVVRTGLHRLHGLADVRIGRDQHHGQMAVRLANGLQHLDAVEPRHADVQKNDVRRVRADHLDRLLTVGGGKDPDALHLQDPGQNAAHRFFVIDDEGAQAGIGNLFHRTPRSPGAASPPRGQRTRMSAGR